MDKSVYIHIPFCIRKCLYCDFVSFPYEENRMEAYVKVLCVEISGRERAGIAKTIYFGGGTPSLLSGDQLNAIMEALSTRYEMDPDVEITCEVNPGTVTLSKLIQMKQLGINRLSIGMQSSSDQTLVQIGRIHTHDDFIQCFMDARKAGFTNISIDLMTGLPGSSFESEVYGNLETIKALDPEHISVYSLKIEENTPFHLLDAKGKLLLPTAEEELKVYDALTSELKTLGYHRYEISNYAKIGFESKHNLAYWTMKAYDGYGVAAHGFSEGVRYENVSDMASYLEKLNSGDRPIKEQSIVTEADFEFEAIMLGLRLTKGIRVESIAPTIMEKIKIQIQLGTMDQADGCVFMTKRGFEIQNAVLVDILY